MTAEFEDQLGVTRFIPLNGVPTKILIYDERLRQPGSGTGTIGTPFNYDTLILMISGNPGEIEYYRNYLARVHELTKLPVIGISNSGHNLMPAKVTMPDVFENPDLYSLAGQVLNKVAFIEQFLTKRTRLILLGHSIGSYMIIELLAQYPQINQMVDHCVLVMPSLDHMADTKVGQKVTRMFTYGYYPLLTLSYVLHNLLPERVKKFLVTYVLKNDSATFSANSGRTIPSCVIHSATNLFSPNCLRALVHMTKCEFTQVKDPNLEAIEANAQKLTILYGEKDHWAPVPFFERLRARASPSVDMRLCLGQIDHAFVIDREGTEMIAKLTVDILTSKVPKK